MKPYKPTIVAFSGKRGSGKSEATVTLVQQGFVEVKFADPLKNMLREMYRTCGLESRSIESRIEGTLKEASDPYLLGKTPRFAMQKLGTEWRDFMGASMWSEMLKLRIIGQTLGDKIVISDLRFDHEAKLLQELGARIIRIRRPLADAVEDEASQHISETSVDTIPYDTIVNNDGSISDFRKKVLGAI